MGTVLSIYAASKLIMMDPAIASFVSQIGENVSTITSEFAKEITDVSRLKEEIYHTGFCHGVLLAFGLTGVYALCRHLLTTKSKTDY